MNRETHQPCPTQRDANLEEREIMKIKETPEGEVRILEEGQVRHISKNNFILITTNPPPEENWKEISLEDF